MAADFDGDTIIELARSEAALSKYAKSSPRPELHSIAITNPALAKLKNIKQISETVKEAESVRETVKERSLEIMIGFLARKGRLPI